MYNVLSLRPSKCATCMCYVFLLGMYGCVLKKTFFKMAAWVSVPLKCRGQVLQVRHVVQCSFASLLPKIDSKYAVPIFISARTKALRTLIFLNEIHYYFNEIHTFFPAYRV